MVEKLIGVLVVLALAACVIGVLLIMLDFMLDVGAFWLLAAVGLGTVVWKIVSSAKMAS